MFPDEKVCIATVAVEYHYIASRLFGQTVTFFFVFFDQFDSDAFGQIFADFRGNPAAAHDGYPVDIDIVFPCKGFDVGNMFRRCREKHNIAGQYPVGAARNNCFVVPLNRNDMIKPFPLRQVAEVFIDYCRVVHDFCAYKN